MCGLVLRMSLLGSAREPSAQAARIAWGALFRSGHAMDPSRVTGQLCTNVKQSVFERALVSAAPGPQYMLPDGVGKQPLSTRQTSPAFRFGTSPRDERLKNGEITS